MTITAVVCLLLTSATPAAAVKVLTVESAGGPAASVGDRVVAKLETSGKIQFVKENGEIACTSSELIGDVASNPESGAGKAKIEVENYTFGSCTTTIGGAGSIVKRVLVEMLPLFMTTEGTNLFEVIQEKTKDFAIELAIETAGKEEIACNFIAASLQAKYENANSEIHISQLINKSVENLKNCNKAPNNTFPNMKAKYRPFQDETGMNKGKRIFIN